MISNRLWIGYIILSLAVLCQGCGNNQEEKAAPLRNVIIAEISEIGATSSSSYSGVLEEGKSVNAAFMTGGKLLSLYAKEGDRVNKGQLLAALDNADYLIGVSQLKVQFDQMTAEKERMDEMYARHNIAPNDYEKFAAGYEQLRLQLEMANNKLGYTKLYSPADGYVAFKFMEPGELVDAGTPIYKVTDDSKLEVSVDLPLYVFLHRDEIQRAYGIVPSVEGEIPLQIASFTPDADNNQLYHMKLDMPVAESRNLTPGMNITVWIEMLNREKGETLVPSRSLFTDEGKTYVWVLNPQDSTLSKKEVSVNGQPQGDRSVVEGLDGSEKIVAAGVKQLREGEKVNVIEGVVKPQ